MPVADEIPASPAAAPTVTPPTEAQMRMASNLSMQPKDAAEINDLFFAASASERTQILHNLAETPLRASARIPAARAARAVEALEMAAWVGDIENFTLEISETLILPSRVAAQVVSDPGGEPLACAARALDMPGPVFQRVTLFLNPEFASVNYVYRLSRLYDRLSERSALIMLAAWRGSTMAVTRAKYRPWTLRRRTPARALSTGPDPPRRATRRRCRAANGFPGFRALVSEITNRCCCPSFETQYCWPGLVSRRGALSCIRFSFPPPPGTWRAPANI